MTAAQPEADRIIGIGDKFYHHARVGGGTVRVVKPGVAWNDVARDDLIPAEADPANADEAARWCALFENLPECEKNTAVILFLDPATGDPMMQAIDGPKHDHDVAIRIVARDLAAVPKESDPRVVPLKSVAPPKKQVPANDNNPPAAIDAQTLLDMEFPPVKYVVPGFIAEGLTILGGRPKLGKSWLALGVCVAVATGGQALGAACEQGDVLYAALEDNQRRLQDRLLKVLSPLRRTRPDMSRLHFWNEAPRIGAGLIERLDEWRRSVSNPRLIVIDTLALVRPPKMRTQDSYEADYAALSPLQKYAGEHRLAIVVVTHVRKAEAADPLEMISGTNGLTGASDTIMVLDRTSEGTKLYGRGRDIEEIEKALRFEGCRWSVLGDVDDVKRSSQRAKIVTALTDAELPMKPAEIAAAAGMKVDGVRHLLPKMVTAGEVEKLAYGCYRLTKE